MNRKGYAMLRGLFSAWRSGTGRKRSQAGAQSSSQTSLKAGKTQTSVR